MTKIQQQIQLNTHQDRIQIQHSSKTSSKRIGWSNLHYNLNNCRSNKEIELKDLVLLDSDSTNTIFCNRDHVENMKKAKIPLEIQTNGRTLTLTQTCKIPFLGTHWFVEGAITNIISLADLSKNYRVTMDTANEKTMIVHLKDRHVKFSQMPGGLYACNPKLKEKECQNQISKKIQNYSTVNKKYTVYIKEAIKKSTRCKKITKCTRNAILQILKSNYNDELN